MTDQSNDEPIDLVMSDAFRAYCRRLRRTWPAVSRSDSASPGDTGPNAAPMASASDPDRRTADPQLSRRQFSVFTAVAVGSVASSGTAAADSEELSITYEGDTPEPVARGTVRVAETALDGEPLAFVEDDGTEASLADYGGRIQTPQSDDEPHNPVTIRPDWLRVEEFGAFPRGETDGDDDPISVLDAEYWVEEDSTIAITTGDPAPGGDAVHFEATGLSDGEEAVGAFTEAPVTSGVPRKYFQAVVDVESVAGTIELRATDGSETVVTETISSGGPQVIQTQFGELDDDLDAIERIKIAAVDVKRPVVAANSIY